MKPKTKKVIFSISAIFFALSSAVVISIIIKNQNNDNGGFDPGDRYESTLMDYMGVVYESQSDIYAFTGGYSNTTSCPWGTIHHGIDYAMNNNSNVLAAIPGQIVDILVQDYGESMENRFIIHVVIRFNASLTVDYAFEPWTNKTIEKDHQLELFDIEEGQWVQKGDKIATFLKAGPHAHIHFMIHENNIAYCPCKYLGDADRIELLSMIHSFQPTWNLCYH